MPNEPNDRMAGSKQPENRRTWIVTLTARAAVRLAESQQINIIAGPGSTAPVLAIRLRNHLAYSGPDTGEGAPVFVGGLTAEVAGQVTDRDAGIGFLANFANSYFQIIALAANAAIDEPEDLVAYAPPRTPTEDGEFLVQRHAQPRSPAVKLRTIHAADLQVVLKAIQAHPAEEQMHRALAHYRMALGYLGPQDRVLAAESLWMAVENLSKVILDRLRREAGLSHDAKGKHDLAVALGFMPRHACDRAHLSKLDGHIRRELIFAGDKLCYSALADLSNGFEHGYMSFEKVQEHSKVTDVAFGHIRSAILQELGVPATSKLLAAKMRSPLGDWRPAHQMKGRYRDSAAGSMPGTTPETLSDTWPEITGLAVVPLIKRVEDHADGTRSIRLETTGTVVASETQKLCVDETLWILPGVEGEPPPPAPEITLTVNGETIEQVRSSRPETA